MDEYTNRRRVDICAACGGAVWQNRYEDQDNCYCSYFCKVTATKQQKELNTWKNRKAAN